ncbi:predicted nucleic acid-binding protein [Candidatus Moduliflexus flocculans]|uniref:Predicted nucleic acid-binding protein n=1 Tax=Candidatus Moduliflexus flocculans TaxID=1499966 RepID=A0A0S6VTV0_9BACT|nr:predicted nucleic acid-binding protein [Candidatus Moduliflexus flocculans]
MKYWLDTDHFPTNDIWIAAIARAHRLTLVTNDEQFKYIDGVTLESWLE